MSAVEHENCHRSFSINMRGCEFDVSNLLSEQQQQDDESSLLYPIDCGQSSVTSCVGRPSLSHLKACQKSLFESAKKLASEQRKLAAFDKEEEASWSGTTMEIEPGVFLPLRGAEETLCGLVAGRLRHATCWGCEASLSCLLDADYILCPKCRIISPLEKKEPGIIGGVGLGLEAAAVQQQQPNNNNNADASRTTPRARAA
mmetsp:Transcript_34336/g.52725  ORF Transcript_34336/g.52725 Transcript_34336/m.52725 type:complete len:201 (-) Transcript_34336:276-878(-)|eukprot:CAMPEP_0118701696 /NCGR_PEP_ID=MMETSP0800-20121206/17416_1 /TAXON_ID=210618 ORGANISM="Striatella unipunctata, Strain CCMP2910" /NCGR_SAMPLE_ID=MMETSP0800 /ASSEMBLY_ACC=CAM_ASM_000638 /LENGTH=200 /DNA_ID=CAMNT_0006602689 /DNA_START=35 /DNA_END=637 /DNA_ORIENTATION=+